MQCLLQGIEEGLNRLLCNAFFKVDTLIGYYAMAEMPSSR